ncbi:MAG: hypothetical protein WC360_08165 [Opitutales bacterium]|jgi:hypothetical protein
MPADPSIDLYAAAPVSHVLPEHLNERVILCCGEVEDELTRAFRALDGKALFVQQYRCYKVWKYADFTLILAGIGTGTLEPLLWEILPAGIVKKIVLIGTAGCVSPSAPAMGCALPIRAAYPCGTGIDAEVGFEPLLPDWPTLPKNAASCTIASSDFFYGYSDRVLDGSFRACQGPFRERYKAIRDRTDLIDMEVAPFYYFAPRFAPANSLEYIAIKGSSNALGKGEEMNYFSGTVMEHCADQAMNMLGIRA